MSFTNKRIAVYGSNEWAVSKLLKELNSSGAAYVAPMEISHKDPYLDKSIAAFFDAFVPDIVMSLSSFDWPMPNAFDYECNVRADLSLIRNSKRCGIDRYVHLSPVLSELSYIYDADCLNVAFEQHPSSYDYSRSFVNKAIIDGLINDSGIDTTIMYYPDVYGPGFCARTGSYEIMPFPRHFLLNSVIGLMHSVCKCDSDTRVTLALGNKDDNVDSMYISDIARAAIFMLDKKAYPYVIARSDVPRWSEILAIVRGNLGYKGHLEFDDNSLHTTSKLSINAPDIKSIGFVPKVSIEEGIRKTADWFSKGQQ